MFARMKVFTLVFLYFVCVTAGPVKPHLNKWKRSIDLITALERVTDNRLPRDVTPSGYLLHLQPFIEEQELQGSVVINITCQEDTDKITLHAHADLEITESDLVVRFLTLQPVKKVTTTTTTEAPVVHVPAGAARLLPCSVCNTADQEHAEESSKKTESVPETVDEETPEKLIPHVVPLTISRTERQANKQRYIIHLADRLKRGEHYQIDIKFTAPIPTETKDGIYLESYVEKETGERREFVATQMRPNHARRVFPCFDEPSFKVPFEISITHCKNYSAISNMPIANSEPIPGEAGLVKDHFQKTPPIPTYRLGLIISEFEYLKPSHVEGSEKRKPCVKVYGRKDLMPSLQRVVDITPIAIKAVEEYLNIPFPLPKLDLVALPGYSDLPDSNWGLQVFKESDLAVSSDEILYQLISKEIIYQWIGNLVTPHWWSDAHVNKAIVNFLSTIITNKIDKNAVPNSSIWTKYYPLYYEYGRNHPYKRIPLQRPPNTVTKSELILRMMNYTLTGETFKKGIHHFISERPFKTFTQDDVWTALTEQAGHDETLPEPATCNQIANSWLKKERLPYVKVTRGYDNKTAVVEQHVFIREIPEEEVVEEQLTWWIPVVLVREDNLKFTVTHPLTWMKEERSIILKNLPDQDKFIIVNPEEIGPYLVNYDRQNWFLISQYLEKTSKDPRIPAATRAKLVHDALNLAYGGKLKFDVALNVTRFLIDERDPIVWQPMFNMIDHILKHIEGNDTAEKFQIYVRTLLGPAYEELDAIEERTPLQERMHRLAKSALCNAGYEQCVLEAQGEWQKWMESEEPDAGVPIHQQHFCWVFKWGAIEEWEFGLQRYFNFPLDRKQADRYYLLKTLVSCPKDSATVERLLDVTMINTSSVPESSTSNNMIGFMLSVLTNEAGYTALFNLLADNYDTIRSKFEAGDNHLWENIVSAATRNFKTQDGLAMVSELYLQRQGEFGTAEPIIEQSLKHVKQNVKWTEQNVPVIDQWLDSYLGPIDFDDD